MEKTSAIVKTEPEMTAMEIKEENYNCMDSDEIEELQEESLDIPDGPVKQEITASGEEIVNMIQANGTNSRPKSELTAAQKAILVGTCMSFLDSSSSSDDEDILLLWLLYMSKKKKLTKRSRRK